MRRTASIRDLLAGAVALSAAEQMPLASIWPSRPRKWSCSTAGGPLRELLEGFGAWEAGARPPGHAAAWIFFACSRPGRIGRW